MSGRDPKIDRREFIVAGSATATLAAIAPVPLRATQQRLRVVGLKVEHIDCPLGLDNPCPRLSWQLESDARNVRQGAYRIGVASSKTLLESDMADLWDSGRIESAKCFDIEYRGSELKSRQRCWWCTEVWDNHGNRSKSDVSWWEMGLLSPEDWAAQWLTVEDAVSKADRKAGFRWIWKTLPKKETSRTLRGAFHLPVASKGGVLFAQGARGTLIKSLWIDGMPIDRGAAPSLAGEWIKVRQLAAGDHAFAVEVDTYTLPPLFPSFVHGLAFFARLDLESGDTFRVASGPDWKSSSACNAAWQSKVLEGCKWEDVDRVALDAEPWPATPAMHLRRVFSVPREVVSARLYATALGVYEARLNGQRIGDALLTPEMTQYSKRLFYRVYDVTEQVRGGSNVLGLTIGDGWYAGFEGRFAWGPPPRRALAQLDLTLADGSRHVVATGPGWRTAPSAIQASQIRQGETYDARLEQPGWDTEGFDEGLWNEAELARAPPCRLVAQVSPPIRATQELEPRSISQVRPGVQVVDFGQNFAGWCRVRVQGERGTRIELKFAELLTPSGEIDQSSMGLEIGEPGRVLPKTDVFVLKGGGSPEPFEPKFTHRGFRYVEISGLPAASALLSVEGIVIHSDLDRTGQLRIDSPLIMQIWRNIVWTQRSNFIGVQTDNPNREQRAWLGDTGMFADTASFNMDIAAFTARRLDDARDDQFESGAFPQIAPGPKKYNILFSDLSDLGSTPAWGDAPLILAWTLWRRYGDTAVIPRNWEVMNRYVQFILEANPDYIWRHKRGLHWGDHGALDQRIAFLDATAPRGTPLELIGTAYWAHSVDILAQMAQAIGKQADAQRLAKLFDRVRRAFNEQYVKPDGTVGTGSQTSQVLALKFGLLSPEMARLAAQKLAADLKERGVALTTGIVGTQFILDVLADAGFAELAYGLLLRTEYPSWGDTIRNGATTIWENWKRGNPQEGDSRNQPGFGSIGGFLFRRIAGIDAATPGFETIEIRPALDPRVKRGGGDYDSTLGRISTDWEQTGESDFTLDVTIPTNAIARIHLPVLPNSRITEGRREVRQQGAPRIVERHDREAIIEAGSGTYRFRVVN